VWDGEDVSEGKTSLRERKKKGTAWSGHCFRETKVLDFSTDKPRRAKVNFYPPDAFVECLRKETNDPKGLNNVKRRT